MKVVDLPSGAKLRMNLAPFADSRALYQAVLEEAKELKIDPETELDSNLWKDLICSGFSSKKIEHALEKCMARCLYGDKKITNEVFEDEEARGDYMMVCFEVAKANIEPFLKSLYARFSPVLGKLNKRPE